MRNWIRLDQLPRAPSAFLTSWHGKNMVRETLTDMWAITDSQSCEANFSLECMHELNPRWLKVRKQNKRNRVEVLDMGVCNGEATLSAVPSHPHQDSKLLIPLRHKVILSDMFQNAWDGQSLDFFFNLFSVISSGFSLPFCTILSIPRECEELG